MAGDYRHERDAAPRPAGDTARREANRRALIRQRAAELKRALQHSTMLLTGRKRRAEGNKVVHKARRSRRFGSSFWHWGVILFGGPLSMLVPFPSTCSLRGQVLTSDDVASLPRAIVYAQPAECGVIDYAEPGVAALDAPGQMDAEFEAQIVRLMPHAAALDAKPACQIELELHARPDMSGKLLSLQPGAALKVDFPAEPRSWFAVLVDQAAGDGKVNEASLALRTQMTSELRHVQVLLRETELGRAFKACIADLVGHENADDEAAQ